MSRFALILRRTLVFTGLTATGVVMFFWLHRADEPTKRRRAREGGQAVRVLEVASHTAVARAVGYGIVEAQRNWQGLAEVGGRVVQAHERLEVGRLVREGTVLFKIDPGAYAIEQDRTQATVKATRAQISEIKARETSARNNLAVEQKVLALARKDYARLKELYDQGTVSLLDVEAAERDVLSAERSVLTYKNTLNELPASRKVLQANLEQVKAGVAGAALDLSRTEIVAPFTMRIREVNAIEGQAISAGQVLVVGDAVDVMEVPAQLSLASVTPLMRRRGRRNNHAGTTEPGQRRPPGEAQSGGEPATSEESSQQNPESEVKAPAGDASSPITDGKVAQAINSESQGRPRRGPGRNIQAAVSLKSQGMDAHWPAEFRRFEGIDSTTHTMGVVVQVQEPRSRDNPNQPRLTPGMHVEVELTRAGTESCLAVPREAIHDGSVWVVDRDSRLEIRPVEVSIAQEDFICISMGISEGEQVVLTDLAPAVAGMKLSPRVDDLAAARIAAATQGNGAGQ